MATEVKRNQDYTASLSLGSDPDGNAVTLTLTHDWGTNIFTTQAATRTATGEYEYTIPASSLQSGGIHKLTWAYTVSGTATTTIDYIDVYEPYLNKISFFIEFPELDTPENDDAFTKADKVARKIVDTYVGYSFIPVYSQYLTFDGTGKRNLFMSSQRLQSFSEVLLVDTGTTSTTTLDITTSVELIPNDNRFLRYKSLTGKFSTSSTVKITGDWGWPYVPINVQEATKLILAELFSDDSIYTKHLVSEAYMDTHRLRFNERMQGFSTGNLDADTLLMDYVEFIMEEV